MTRFYVKEPHVTHCVYMFCMILRIYCSSSHSIIC